MNLPERMVIRVSVDGNPAPRMFVCVTIKSARKNDFGFVFGPTDQDGVLFVMRSDLLREAETDRRMFIMDYGHPEQDFTGEIVVTPLSRDALKGAIAAYDLYQHVTPYPPRYAEQIQEARMLLEELKPKSLSVEIEHDGEGIVVRGETVDA